MLNRPAETAASATPSLRSGDSGPRPQLRATPPSARRVETPSATPSVRPSREPSGRIGQYEGRRMVVAKEITLAGQISKCDYLVVEGVVEGMRYDGQSLEVSEGGAFNGSIEVDSAEIAGTIEGVLNVRGRLTIRPTGKVTGTIRYGEIEINAGGQVSGELQALQPAETARTRSGGFDPYESFSSSSSEETTPAPAAVNE